MLHVKRASAGSGKTYELAKMYIKLLLTVKEDRKKRRLRDEGSLAEALSSIMAVTFTVKATAEMKQRIVNNLAALAKVDDMPDEEAEKVDYFKDFRKELGSKYDIARLSRKALRHLLLHYSDFKVQTIDSFFQSVLHTFAYEASLDDNFNMELDSNYINAVGFDSALDSLSRKSSHPEKQKEVLYWLNTMMKERSDRNKWNVFARREGSKNLYTELVKETANLEKEEFHKIKEELETYFKNLATPFNEVVEKVGEGITGKLKELYEDTRAAAIELKDELDRVRLSSTFLYNRTSSRFLESLKAYDFKKLDLDKLSNSSPLRIPDNKPGCSLGSKGKPEFENNCRKYPDINISMLSDLDSAFLNWEEKYNDLLEYIGKEAMILSTWQHYLKMFPRLVLSLEIAERKREFLDSTNTLQISDTTHLLSRIIDKEDTPFVYERMGSRLNHYLIDEFQDTSRMQWENLYPLVSNSEASDYDNLIIGDAKQSIYRFRSADYKLIQEVGEMFHNVVPYTSDERPKDLKKENTNYRSKPRVVELNNFIFSTIIETPNPADEKTFMFDEGVRDIYKDCIQALPEKEKENEEENSEAKESWKGYVELQFHPNVAPDKEVSEEDEGNVSTRNPGFIELPGRILELKSRGYRYSDIGILVKSHEQGAAAISAITRYNNENPANPIPVISEENLMVGGSLSVRIIIRALEMAARGMKSELPENPVLREPVGERELFGLLKELPTVALPALVEALLEKFVPEKRRNSEASFIAAFQDAVLDYCASHSGDIGQFLKWWKRKSKTLTINSPEDSDGVKIQTIHKAKGLEYKCVIIPYANFNFSPGAQHSEWRWVKPASDLPGAEFLPPYIPVDTIGQLANTFHADVRKKYCEEVALDELNKLYVGFTRAAHELYIYLPYSPKKEGPTSASGIIRDMLAKESEAEEHSPLLDADIIVENGEEGRIEIRYGKPATCEEVLKEQKTTSRLPKELTKYEVSTKGAIMQFENGNKLLNTTGKIIEEGEDADPRAEGNLKHRIMQMVEYPDDLSKALLEMKSEGLINGNQLIEWKKELSDAIRQVEKYKWFDAGMRIINERPILQRDKISYRPDRIVVDAEKNATIIDYKFGVKETKHQKQVKNYASLLDSSGNFRSVGAYLWYVAEDEIVKVI